jgi:hypothetical protein
MSINAYVRHYAAPGGAVVGRLGYLQRLIGFGTIFSYSASSLTG